MKVLVILSLLTVASNGLSLKQQRSFPVDFMFGCTTSAYQIEGAWDEDGKGENICDHVIHNQPTVIKDLSNGDIAADSYHNYKRDVEIMRELGLDAYHFSLSWSRILPTGFANEINPAAINYYNNLINEMLKYNIKPMATLYHWDLPQNLQELGGLLNPLIAEWFEDYARVAYEHFGDRVKYWITINEPREICYEANSSTIKAPILNPVTISTYLCAKRLLLAHANAYHAYNNDFRPTQGGVCGISFAVSWYDSLTDSDEDKFAAELKRQFEYGLYSDPIFSEEGGYPKEIAARIAEKSAQRGFSKSLLPEFTEEEKVWIRGTSDFYGVNHYTGRLISVTRHKVLNTVLSYDDLDIGAYVPEDWQKSAADWLIMAPKSLYNSLMDVHKRYNAPVLYVIENGWADTLETGLTDDLRITYYKAALEDVLDLIQAGVNIKGYMAWSMIDTFEWLAGYSNRFGFYNVDFDSPARTRTPKKSAFVYKHIIKNRYIDYDYEPESMNMTIDKFH